MNLYVDGYGDVCIGFAEEGADHATSLCEDGRSCHSPVDDKWDSLWEGIADERFYTSCDCKERLAERLGFEDVDEMERHARQMMAKQEAEP